MFQLPPIPAWDGLHPLIIHFPIALLFVVPAFIFVGAILPPVKGRPLLYSALILMAIGTLSTFFAISTGEAAGKLAERSPEVNAILEHHQELAETTRMTFSALTAVFAAILLVPLLRRNSPGRLSSTIAPLLFLVLYGAGMMVLTNTADQGGRLVHQLGIHAIIPSQSAPQSQEGSQTD